MQAITEFLQAVEKGEPRSTEELVPLVYDELRHLAAYRMAQEKPGQTLQATALVHETYLRLAGSDGHGWESKRHFFGAAAEAMRRIMIENERRKGRQKRGRNPERVDLDPTQLALDPPSPDVLALNEAIEHLAKTDADAAELVKLRFFAGLTLQQCAECLDVSRRTADNLWAFAKAWLYREMRHSDDSPGHDQQ